MTGDPGLQPERTRLAWRRTVLTLTGVAVLTVRLALARGQAGALLGVVAVTGWAVVLRVTWRRAAGGRQVRVGGEPALALTALAAAGYALLGVLLVVGGLY